MFRMIRKLIVVAVSLAFLFAPVIAAGHPAASRNAKNAFATKGVQAHTKVAGVDEDTKVKTKPEKPQKPEKTKTAKPEKTKPAKTAKASCKQEYKAAIKAAKEMKNKQERKQAEQAAKTRYKDCKKNAKR